VSFLDRDFVEKIPCLRNPRETIIFSQQLQFTKSAMWSISSGVTRTKQESSHMLSLILQADRTQGDTQIPFLSSL